MNKTFKIFYLNPANVRDVATQVSGFFLEQADRRSFESYNDAEAFLEANGRTLQPAGTQFVILSVMKFERE